MTQITTSLTPREFRHELISILASLTTLSKRIPEESLDPRLRIILDGAVTKAQALVNIAEAESLDLKAQGSKS